MVKVSKKGIIPSFCDTKGRWSNIFVKFLFLVGPVRAENVLFLLKYKRELYLNISYEQM